MAGRHVRPFGGNLGSSAAAMRTAASPTLVPRAPLLVSRRGGGARGPQSFRGALSRASRVAVGPRHSCRMEPAASSAGAVPIQPPRVHAVAVAACAFRVEPERQSL